MRAAVLMLLSACATTANTCPLGTRIGSSQSSDGRAEFCRTTESRLSALPAGRTSANAAAMLLEPTAMPGGLTGPFTSWRADGSLASHGEYVDEGSRSIPDGVWAFWYPNGQRKSLGVYRQGRAQGCFALWDESGERITGHPDGDQLRIDNCTPPDDTDIAIVEGRARGAIGPVLGDATLHAFVGPNGIGAREANQFDPDPRMQVGFEASARRRFGPILLGPLVALRLSSNFDYRGYVFGGIVGYTRALSPRIDFDASLSLALDVITATARRSDLGTSDQRFLTALPSAQVGIAYALSPMIQAVLAARVDGFPAHDELRAVSYCRDAGGPFLQCSTPQQEMWRIGGLSYGATVGIRLVLR